MLAVRKFSQAIKKCRVFCSAFFCLSYPSTINRLTANLLAVCERVDEDRLADDLLAVADRDSGLACRPEDVGRDFDKVGGHPEGAHLVDVGPDFDREDGRLADDLPADVGHDSGMADDHPAGARPVDAGRGFDREDDRLVDDLPADVDHDSGTDVRLAGLGRVAVLRVSRCRHHRAHTNCGIQPDWHPAHEAGAGHDSDREHDHPVGDHLADVGPGSDMAGGRLADDLPVDADLDFERAGDPPQVAVRVELRRDYRNYRRADRRYRDVFHQKPDGHCLAVYGCQDALHRHPSDH